MSSGRAGLPARTALHMLKGEDIMDTAAAPSTARRTEDIALDLLKFIAGSTNVVKATGTTAGFGPASATKPDDQVTQLLELYSRCRKAVESRL